MVDHILLPQIKYCGGEETIPTLRLIFDTCFPLLARCRLQRLPVGGNRRGLKRGGVADIGRNTVIEHIAETNTTCQLVIILV
ncbi:hypothetical protein D3C80_1715610 [compost metagenome]